MFAEHAEKAFKSKYRKESLQRVQRQGLHRDTAAQRRSGDLVIGSSGERAPSPNLRVANTDFRVPVIRRWLHARGSRS
jgi:hypothetical protein